MKYVRMADLVGRFKRPKPEPAPVPVVVTEHDLSRSLRMSLEAADAHERNNGDEPRTIIMIPGVAPILDGEVEPAQALAQRFPAELPTPAHAEVAARYLRQALRARNAMRRREAAGKSWVMDF